MALDQQYLLFEIGAPCALVSETCGEIGVTRADDALLDEIEHVLDSAIDARALGAKCFQMCLPLTNGRRTVVQQIGQQHLKALRPKKSIGQGVDDDGLQCMVTHADSGARGFTATQTT